MSAKPTEAAPAAREFAAFISYAHDDDVLATRLATALESYRTPRTLVREGRRARLGHVFRDRDELRAGDGLGDALRDALENSAALVVVCSPRAAMRPWIDVEIRAFRALHPRRPVVPVLIEGTPEIAFPPALREAWVAPEGVAVPGREPIAADLRLPHREARFAEELLRVAAPILGVEFDDLRRREERRRLRRWISMAAALATGLVILAGLSTYALWQRRVAERRLSDAVDAANAIVFDIDQELAPLPAVAQARIAILQTAQRLLTRLDGAREERDVRVLYADAVVEGARGDLARNDQAFEDAQGHFTRAASAAAELVRRAPGLPRHQLLLLLAHCDVGQAALAAGDPARARRAFEAGRAVLARLEASASDTVDVQRAGAQFYEALGDLEQDAAQWDAATSAYDQALTRVRRVIAAKQRSRERLDEALLLDKLGRAAEGRGDREAARVALRAALDARQQALREGAVTLDLERDVGMSLHRLGRLELDGGRVDVAEGLLGEALALRQKLESRDPDDRRLRGDVAESLEGAAALAEARGLVGDAERARADACERWSQLHGAEPRAVFFAQNWIACLDRQGDLGLEGGDWERAARAWSDAERVVQMARTASVSLPMLDRTRAVLLEKQAELHRRRADNDRARADLRECVALRRAALARVPTDPTTRIELVAGLERSAELERAAARLPAARVFANEAVEVLTGLASVAASRRESRYARAAVLDQRARVALAMGQRASAVEDARAARQSLEQDADDLMTALARLSIATTLVEAGDAPDVRSLVTMTSAVLPYAAESAEVARILVVAWRRLGTSGVSGAPRGLAALEQRVHPEDHELRDPAASRGRAREK